MRILVVGLLGAFVALGSAFAKDAHPQNEGRRLGGKEILSMFSDAEFSGAYLNGQPDWAERTTADGRVLDLNNQSALVGAWAASADFACYIYFAAPSDLVCYAIYDSDGSLLFYDSATNRLVTRTNKTVPVKPKS